MIKSVAKFIIPVLGVLIYFYATIKTQMLGIGTSGLNIVASNVFFTNYLILSLIFIGFAFVNIYFFISSKLGNVFKK